MKKDWVDLNGNLCVNLSCRAIRTSRSFRAEPATLSANSAAEVRRVSDDPLRIMGSDRIGAYGYSSPGMSPFSNRDCVTQYQKPCGFHRPIG